MSAAAPHFTSFNHFCLSPLDTPCLSHHHHFLALKSKILQGLLQYITKVIYIYIYIYNGLM